ncbi:MAG: hypothetical protein LUQ11_03395, partial [Methylococcaceae bacterium]|nr:hypothetical protein [Methylococcaceae bacterium]
VTWEIGSHDWIPLIDEGNGTFTASWVTPATISFAPGGGKQFSMTFTPMPTPSAVWIMGSGLLGLLGLNSRRQSDS